MKKKIMGILVCTLVFASTIASASVIKNEKISTDVNEKLLDTGGLNARFINNIFSITIIIKNTKNYERHNVHWRLDVAPHDMPFFREYLEYPDKPISGSQDILEANGEIRFNIKFKGFGLIWNSLCYGADGITYDTAYDSFIFGRWILFLTRTFP